MRLTLAATVLLASTAMPAFAQDVTSGPARRDGQNGNFRLGEIIVTAARPQGIAIG